MDVSFGTCATRTIIARSVTLFKINFHHPYKLKRQTIDKRYRHGAIKNYERARIYLVLDGTMGGYRMLNTINSGCVRRFPLRLRSITPPFLFIALNHDSLSLSLSLFISRYISSILISLLFSLSSRSKKTSIRQFLMEYCSNIVSCLFQPGFTRRELYSFSHVLILYTRYTDQFLYYRWDSEI